MSEIAVITGGTSGIGRATALCLRDAGYDVYELSRREQMHPVLHRVLIAVIYTEQGIMVGNGHGVQTRPRRHERQTVDGHRAIGTGRMIVKIAGHRN